MLERGWAHHIERLMVLGNAMCLLRIDPDAAYEWFMEMFVDAYDWVMVPNVYAMSQFAAGEAITTKPYVSGSNYLRKMSDLPRGSGAPTGTRCTGPSCATTARSSQEPALRMIANLYDGMDAGTKSAHTRRAGRWLSRSGRCCTPWSCSPTTTGRPPYVGTGRRCARRGCRPSSTTAGPATPRTSPCSRPPDVSAAAERRRRDDRVAAARRGARGRAAGPGPHRLTVARALDVPDALVAAVLALRAGTTDLPHEGWLPHVTLARRVERADLQRVVDTVGAEDVVLRLATLRRWDPEASAIELLVTT